MEYIDDIHASGIWKNSDPINLKRMAKEKPVVLYFWHSDTPETIETLHELNDLAHAVGDVCQFITIHAPEFADEPDVLDSLLETFKISLPVVHDPDFHIWQQFHVHHPSSFVVIDDAKEVMRRVGDLQNSGMKEYLLSLTHTV